MNNPMPAVMVNAVREMEKLMTTDEFPDFYKDGLFYNCGIHVVDGTPVRKPPFQKNYRIEPAFCVHELSELPEAKTRQMHNDTGYEEVMLPGLAYGLMLETTSKPIQEHDIPFSEAAVGTDMSPQDREIARELSHSLKQWVDALRMLTLMQQKVYYCEAGPATVPGAWVKINGGKQWMEITFKATRISPASSAQSTTMENNAGQSGAEKVLHRMLAFNDAHKDSFTKADEQVKAGEMPAFEPHEFVVILADIDVVRAEINATYEAELAKGVTDIDVSDYLSPLMHLDGIRLELHAARQRLGMDAAEVKPV